MAESGLIAAYLRELRDSMAWLPDVDDVVAEAEDHLLSAVEALVRSGWSRAEAEAQALARFGSAALVARVFMEESKRGGAVSTRLTRRAGMAAMAAPVLAATGQTGNVAIDRGAGHGLAVTLLVVAFGAFALALWGLRARHGGLGGWGRAALWLFIASPLLSLPFGWGAGGAFIVLQLVVVALLGMGMIRARVLPVPAVALFTFSPLAALVTAATLTAVGVDAARYVPLGIPLLVAGVMGVGWAMWREPSPSPN